LVDMILGLIADRFVVDRLVADGFVVNRLVDVVLGLVTLTVGSLGNQEHQ